MGKYYDTKIANNPDIRFNGGGEVRPFYDDGNKYVVFKEYRNYELYKIAVDDVNDAKYITLWKTNKNTGIDKKVGTLSLHDITDDDFLSVSYINIDKGNKGLGLGLEMYKIALKYSSDKIKGIKSYLPLRSNKKQIPKIYRKLNSVVENYDWDIIYKKNNPDIRFDGGGEIIKYIDKWVLNSSIIESNNTLNKIQSEFNNEIPNELKYKGFLYRFIGCRDKDHCRKIIKNGFNVLPAQKIYSASKTLDGAMNSYENMKSKKKYRYFILFKFYVSESDVLLDISKTYNYFGIKQEKYTDEEEVIVLSEKIPHISKENIIKTDF
jgi:hypothetical protein